MIKLSDNEFIELQREVEDLKEEKRQMKRLLFTNNYNNNMIVDGGIEVKDTFEHRGTNLGFYKEVPIERPLNIPLVPTGGGASASSNATAINSLITSLENLGLIKKP